MIIRKVRKIKTIKFISVYDDELNSDYIGESFEAITDDNGVVTDFKDWLKGGSIEGGVVLPLVEDPYTIGTFSTTEGWDLTLFDKSYALSNVETVGQLLRQKLLIQYGELDYYFENTSTVGIPYIDKKSKQEMDLIIRNEILSTPGVKEIKEFTSSVVDRVYTLTFSVEVEGGNIVWLTLGA